MKAIPLMIRAIKGLMMRHLPGMVTCAEFEAFIADYDDGRLTDRERRVFAWHLRMCPDCRRYLTAYRRTVEMAGRAFPVPGEPVPDEVPDDLVQAILAARDVRR